jgi:gas vesicle protein
MLNKIILFIIGLVVGLLLATYSCNHISPGPDFKQTTDSLNKVIDTLYVVIENENNTIAILTQKDNTLADKVHSLAKERDKARAEAIKNANNTNLTNTDTLIKFYTNRYPFTDSIHLSLPKISLIEVAKDLLIYDGAKQELIIADSSIFLLGQRIITKDSIIISYQVKDTAYQKIISTQDVKYDVLGKEYKKVDKQNTKLKASIGILGTIAAALTILLIIK